MSVKFCPSIMCMKMDNLKDQISRMERAGIDRFHLDVMDGVFVPNFALGLEDVKSICRLSSKPTELHLMLAKPAEHIELFANTGVDIIFVHPEADYHSAITIQKIYKQGLKPGIVINPGMSVDSVLELIKMVKHVIVMGVTPGYAGQVFFPSLDDKIKQLIALKTKYPFELELDGGCSKDVIAKYANQGVDSFVLGNNSFFKENTSYSETMNHLRTISGGESPDCAGERGKIKLLVTDVDGTLTDGTVYIGENGEAMKGFNIKDGYALHEMLPAHNIIPVIITGRKSKIVENRARELAVKEVHQGVTNKKMLLIELAKKYSCSLSEIAYAGDDMNDIEALACCGYKTCPADAVDAVKKSCDYISSCKGGYGAIRDICERVILYNESGA